ncbi:MAG TPA: ATP-binding protein, partial [Kiloniellales bacterium]|nr:ATP-binding protein [Kiloniellales bacterium]
LTHPSGAILASSKVLEPNFSVAFWLAAGLCSFSIIFGVRNLNVNEHHHGVIAAIAVEAVVKLIALLILGLWVVISVRGVPTELFANAPVSLMNSADTFDTRWITLLFLSAMAAVCLPRQFQVTVVENSSERQIRTASWLFPLYLFLMCLFVFPIAIAGLNRLPSGANPDLYVLTLPLQEGQPLLALLAFIGGFSSATSMVIVSSIALSTMISNHILVPLALRFSIIPTNSTQSVRHFILNTRRASVIFIVFLGFLYFWVSGTSEALADIGLISFCGVAQFMPSLVGGLFWRRASDIGAVTGMAAGFLLWLYTLFLPSFGGTMLLPAEVIANGAFGLAWLKPQALFGLEGLDPLVHAVFWSLFVNTTIFVGISLISEPTPLARLQSALFIDIFRRQPESDLRVIRRTARVDDLKQVAERVIGAREAMELFADVPASERALVASDELLERVEQRLAAHIGAASARSLVSRVVTDETVSVQELKRLASEAEQIRAYSEALEIKSRQIEEAAAELSSANRRLREIDKQKDEFLSHISHEVRTPMASIRSFSDILLTHRDMEEDRKQRFLGIIQKESIRLTRLLDSILHLNQMEKGQPYWDVVLFDPDQALDQALESCEALAQASGVALRRVKQAQPVLVLGNADKLAQVFINLISNAIKHNDNREPLVTITSVSDGGVYEARIADNGPGIAAEDRERIFGKFERGSNAERAGAGLGLPISRQIVERFAGQLMLNSDAGEGAEFIVTIKVARAAADSLPVELGAT